jgi:V/A-type H+-transporting ATPase subunit E
MGLEIVKEEIINNARNQERALLADARKEASEITKKAEKKVAEMKEKNDAETKRKVEIIKRQELASAELENKKMLLEAKKQVIEKVLAEARKKIDKLGSKERQEYMDKLLEKAKKDIEVAVVYCNKNDIKLVKDIKSEAADIIGGLIAENEDKTIRVDYSFDTMIESIQENELQSINKILFG